MQQLKAEISETKFAAPKEIKQQTLVLHGSILLSYGMFRIRKLSSDFVLVLIYRFVLGQVVQVVLSCL